MEGLPAAAAAGRGGRARFVTGRRLVLLRHGRTAWNAGGRFQGQLDPPLDDVGRAQASAAAAVLAALRASYVVSSDLRRASDTAAALGLPARLDSRLREIDLGGWQGLSREEIQNRYPGEWAAWVAGADVRRGGGETYAEVGVRACAALEESLRELEPDGVLVAVTHGGTARAAIGAMLALAPESWWRLAPLGNCRWSVLVETARGWRLAEHNAGDPPKEGGGDDR